MRLGSASELQLALQRIDGKQYGAYHDIEGSWSFPGFVLIIDRSQADAYAPPTRCRVQVMASLTVQYSDDPISWHQLRDCA